MEIKQESAILQPYSLLLRFLGDYKWFGVAIGTATVLAHFWRIRYLPALGVTDVGLVALAILLFSALALLTIGIICALPGFALIGWSTQRVIPRPRGQANGLKRNGVRRGQLRHKANWRSKPFFKAGSGKALVQVYAGFSIALALYAPIALLSERASTIWICAILTLSFAISVFSSIIFDVRAFRYWGLTCTYPSALSIILTTSLYGVSIPFLLAITQNFGPSIEQTSLIPTIIAMSIAPLAHWSIYSTRRMPLWFRAAMPSVVLLYFLCLAGLPFRLVDQALRTFGVGLLNDQMILVSQRGCDIAKASGITSPVK
ncbi:hypothetical protein WIW49_05355 [Xanthomonas euroxanthea]